MSHWKLLLVVPRFISKTGQYYDFPLGLAYISSALKQSGHEVHCLNLNHISDSPHEAIRQAVGKTSPDAICTGGISVHYQTIKAILQLARSIKPSMVQIVGGGVLSSLPEEVVCGLGADVGVIGEGEITVVELADTMSSNGDISFVNGIIFKDGDTTITTPSRKPIMDLDSIAPPDYAGLGLDFYLSVQKPLDIYWLNSLNEPRMIPVITTRSCPYNCTFCYHPIGQTYRERTLDSFFEELNVLVGVYKINCLGIYDELFSHNPERLLEFCARIKPMGVKWMAQLRVDMANKDTLEALRDSGCVSISYGLESMSDVVLKSMRKRTTAAQIKNALRETYNNRIDVQGNFIIGDKAETPETVAETVGWWKQNLHYGINFNMLWAYPGAPLWLDCVKRGLIPDQLAYLEQGCSLESGRYRPVNSTNMSDEAYWKLYGDVDFLHWTLGFPGKLISTEVQPNVDPVRGRLFRVVLQCPHCHRHVVYHDVTEEVMDATRVRISCKECLRRFDWTASITDSRKDIERGFQISEELKRNDRAAEAFGLQHELLNNMPWHHGALSSMLSHYRSIDNRSEMYRLARNALRNKPMDFRLAMEFANVLADMDEHEEAAVYLRQAVILYGTWQAQSTPDDPMKRRRTSPLLKYFSSFSMKFFQRTYSWKWRLEAKLKMTLKKVLPKSMLPVARRWRETLRKIRRG